MAGISASMRGLAEGIGAGLIACIGVLIALSFRRRSTRRVRFVSVMRVPMPPRDEPLIGAVLGGRYILGRALGHEGSCDHFEARDLEDSPRLLKRLTRRGPALLQRAKAAVGLEHPAIATLEATFEDRGHIYLAMLPASGESLRQALDRMSGQRLTPEASLRLLQGVCDALDFVHARGVIHGHLTPSCILVDRACAKVDGFAVFPEPAEADYLAPEQDASGLSPGSDLFSLGVCLYEMLIGERPFKGPQAGQAKHEGSFIAATSLVPALPAGVDVLLARALQPDPARRFHAAGEVFVALRDLVVPGVH